MLPPSPEERQPPPAGTLTANMDQPIGLVIRSFFFVRDGSVYSRQHVPLRRNKKASDAFPILMQISFPQRRPASFCVGTMHKRERTWKRRNSAKWGLELKSLCFSWEGRSNTSLQRRMVPVICSPPPSPPLLHNHKTLAVIKPACCTARGARLCVSVWERERRVGCWGFHLPFLSSPLYLWVSMTTEPLSSIL